MVLYAQLFKEIVSRKMTQHLIKTNVMDVLRSTHNICMKQSSSSSF